MTEPWDEFTVAVFTHYTYKRIPYVKAFAQHKNNEVTKFIQLKKKKKTLKKTLPLVLNFHFSYNFHSSGFRLCNISLFQNDL